MSRRFYELPRIAGNNRKRPVAMIGVFSGVKRIGSLLDFPHQEKPWNAYSIHTKERRQFKTKYGAIGWLRRLHELSRKTETV